MSDNYGPTLKQLDELRRERWTRLEAMKPTASEIVALLCELKRIRAPTGAMYLPGMGRRRDDQ